MTGGQHSRLSPRQTDRQSKVIGKGGGGYDGELSAGEWLAFWDRYAR